MKQIVILGILLACTFVVGASAQNHILEPEKMKQDIAVLKQALTTLHPGLYLYNTKEQFGKYFDDLEASVRVPADERKFYLLLSQLTARIKCGHTFPNPLNLDDDVAARLFAGRSLPLYFVVVDGRIIVTNNYSEDASIVRGDEIVAINGIKTSRIIEKLLSVSRGDGNNSIGKRLSNLNVIPGEDYGHSLFDIYFPLFFPASGERFALRIKHSNGKIVSASVRGVSADQRKAAFEKEFGPIAKSEQTWAARTLNDSTAYLKFGTFSFWNSNYDWKTDIANKFRDIRSKQGIKNLIIDIRGNEGGNGEIRDLILSYITPKQIRGEYDAKLCYRSLNVPDSLLPHLTTWDKHFKDPKDPGKYFMNEIGLYEKKDAEASEPIFPAPDRFAGQVYLLTDAINSSSTFDMAWAFQANKLGIIIGEPTGGTKQGLNGGQMFFLTLPNSKFEIDLPIQHYYHKGYPDEGVIPEYVVRTSPDDIRDKRDRQMEFALQLIASKH